MFGPLKYWKFSVFRWLLVVTARMIVVFVQKTLEGEFLVKKVMSLEGVWFELSVTLQSLHF